jgi:hypothetical protein
MRALGSDAPRPRTRTKKKRTSDLEAQVALLRQALEQIRAQECECSENQSYEPACPHTLAVRALFDLTDGR